jgi:group I intron endonuclease
MTGIYCIECKANGKKYVGQSTRLRDRIASHRKDLKKGLHIIADLQNDYNVFGAESIVFSILENLSDDVSSTDITAAELKYVLELNSIEKGYNKKLPHESSAKAFTPELRQYLKDNNKARDPERRRKISEALMGHEVSEETKRKIGEKAKGRKISEETRAKLREAKRILYLDPAERAKHAHSTPHTDEAKRKIAESKIGRKKVNGKMVYPI